MLEKIDFHVRALVTLPLALETLFWFAWRLDEQRLA